MVAATLGSLAPVLAQSVLNLLRMRSENFSYAKAQKMPNVAAVSLDSLMLVLAYLVLKLGVRAGDNFSYVEAQEMPNVVAATLGSLALVLGYLVLSMRFLRPLVMRVLPAPGQGPSRKQQVEGFW